MNKPHQFIEDQWAMIDSRILACDIMNALKLIRELSRVTLNEAKDIHWERYQRLRSEHPGDFACTDEEYWRGVYG